MSAVYEGSPVAPGERRLAVLSLCAGALLVVLDTTVVNVALPTLRESLAVSSASLVWIVDAYLLTYGATLLLGGGLADLFGHRRVLLTGLLIFSIASLLGGFADSGVQLIAARALQGIGAAAITAATLALLIRTSGETGERARALGAYTAICACGGSLGLLLGGMITSGLGWRWLFWVNVPVGIVLSVVSIRAIPAGGPRQAPSTIDIPGAVLLPLALVMLIWATLSTGADGVSVEAIAGGLVSVVLLILFVRLEVRARSPLVPLRIFRDRRFAIANVICVLWASGVCAWYFIAALALQTQFGLGPLEIGLAFLPANLAMGALSLGLSAYLVERFGLRRPLLCGLLLVTAGLVWFARGASASVHWDVMIPMALIGIGAGLAYNPLVLTAVSDIEPREAGVASGILNTAYTMGGTIGLAALVALAHWHTQTLIPAGVEITQARIEGYQLGYWGAAACTALALVLAGSALRQPRSRP